MKYKTPLNTLFFMLRSGMKIAASSLHSSAAFFTPSLSSTSLISFFFFF
jgi:hypothetical protein